MGSGSTGAEAERERRALWRPRQTIERIPGYCALCTSSCGCISVVEDGRLVAVEPDPSHPTGKALCGKGRAAPELVYHEDRLLHPLPPREPQGRSGRVEADRLGRGARRDRPAAQDGSPPIMGRRASPSASRRRLAPAFRTPIPGSSACATPTAAPTRPTARRSATSTGTTSTRSPSASTRRCRISRMPIASCSGGTTRAPPGSPMPAGLPRRRRAAPSSSSSTRAVPASRSRPMCGSASGPAATALSHWVSPTCSWKPGTTIPPSCGIGPTARCWCARTTARRSARIT